MNYRNNKKRKIIFIVMLAVALTATIGYAVLNTVLKNNIRATISPVSWKVYMENASIYADTTTYSATNTVSLSNTADTCIEYDTTESTICTKSVTLNANVKFDTLDEYVIIKFNATNGGDIPAIIDENGITVEGLRDLVTYSLKYSDQDTGVDVQPGDSLAVGTSKTMYLKLKYAVSDTATELPTEEQSLNITVNIKYIKGSMDDAGNTPDTPAVPVVSVGAPGVIDNSLTGSSTEITSYTTAMTASEPSKLYLLESTKDDEHPIYFWRGTRAATANNFIFANMCWLGIRTTDTGGIKMIYNGVPVDGKCTTISGKATMIGSGHYDIDYKTKSLEDNTQIQTTSKYKDDTKDSNVKHSLEVWYKAKLFAYQSYLEDATYCNDLGNFYSSRRASTPSLACSTDDSYTVANGKLKYPIGLISADEVMFSGMNESASSESFLYNNQAFWTMTLGSDTYKEYMVSSSGNLNSNGRNDFGNAPRSEILAGYRPVITLNVDVEMTGTGTQDNPFVVTIDEAINPPDASETPIVNVGTQSIIDNSLKGSSSEITSYNTAMPASVPSKLYLLESTKDDEHPIYFWRGTRAATANNFIFANMCWLGIRTTDTGGIKIIYNGVPVDGTCSETTGYTSMIGNGIYNNITRNVNYKESGKDSNVKIVVEDWYKKNLLAYQSYLEDTVFCNDLGSFYSSRSTGTPSLACSTEESYTVNNGKLKYKVGLISADEAMFSGMAFHYNNPSIEPFLYNGQKYWTMTKGEYDNDVTTVYSYLFGSGSSGNYAYYYSNGFRPVVSLDANIKTTGTGTQDNPFVVMIDGDIIPPEIPETPDTPEPPETSEVIVGAQGIIANSNVGSSNEITSYNELMPVNYPSKLYLLESTRSSLHPIYFWRGTKAATRNNFIFANMCWLGIRTTDTGGIKIIYNGVPVDGKCTATGESTTIGYVVYNNITKNYKYKDGDTDSGLKTATDEWYKTNLLTYRSYLEDTVFCADSGSFFSSRKPGIGTPSLTCSTEDSYTVSNGKLNYPIGHISADEAVFSGLNSSRIYESFLNNEYTFWTMTKGWDYDNKRIYVVSWGTLEDDGYSDYNPEGNRPVISLNANVEMTGTGTQDNPFVVKME